MSALIAGSAVRTCHGAGSRTFAALLRGDCGAARLRYGDPARLKVRAAYHVGAGDADRLVLPGHLLADCLQEAVRQAGLDPGRHRVVTLVGTGLGELAKVEDWALTGTAHPARSLHFGDVVRKALPGVSEVITLSGACSAGGHALTLAQDLVELGEADAVLVGATDTMTLSMLAMIGRVMPGADRIRPFDREPQGGLLGDGAAALVVVPGSWTGRPLARLAGAGLSCDADHPTAPDLEGICRAMGEAFDRSGRDPASVDLVIAHGTGTALNDPAECAALRRTLIDAGGAPLVTAVKGSVGHTSGSAALINVDVALRCMTQGVVPPVTGLGEPLDSGAGLRFVRGGPARFRPRLVQVDAFGFGGVNAAILVEAA